MSDIIHRSMEDLEAKISPDSNAWNAKHAVGILVTQTGGDCTDLRTETFRRHEFGLTAI